jgi:HAMP domain-containing protein
VPPPSTNRNLRLRGALQAAAGATVGALALRGGRIIPGATALALATIILLAALLSPSRAFLSIDRAIKTAARAIALLLTWTLLSALYVLVFTPIALTRRLRRRDELARSFAREVPTYWRPRPAPRPEVERYERQF